MKIPKFRGYSFPWAVHATSHALMRSQNYLILCVLLVAGPSVPVRGLTKWLVPTIGPQNLMDDHPFPSPWDTLGMEEVEQPAPAPEAVPDHGFDAIQIVVLPS